MLLALFAPPLTKIALQFGPAEYFSLIIIGLISSIALAHGSVLKALAMVVFGLLAGIVGTDVYSGLPRLTMGMIELSDGINVIAVAVGMFGLAEIMRNLEGGQERTGSVNKITNLMPSRKALRASVLPSLRGPPIGALLGVLPGGGAMLSAFTSSALAKRLPTELEHKIGRTR